MFVHVGLIHASPLAALGFFILSSSQRFINISVAALAARIAVLYFSTAEEPSDKIL